MNVYQINDRFETILNEMFDPETGEVFQSQEEVDKALDEVGLELDTKIENIGCYIKNLEYEIDALKKEEDNLYKRRKAAENKIEGLKRYLNGFLVSVIPNDDDRRKWKFKTPRVVLGYRKSTTVEVPDLEKLDKNFIKIKTETSADKTAIKEAIKNGTEVKGAFLKDNINLSIK